MAWYNPFSWFSQNQTLSATSLTSKDTLVLNSVENLLLGERDQIEELIQEIHSIKAASNRETAQSFVLNFLRNLQNFEKQERVVEAFLRDKSRLKGTVLEPLMSIKKR